MDKLRFIHTADLHLGTPFTGSGFDEKIIRERRTDLFKCFDLIIEKTIELDVDALLICGDFFEEERVRRTEINRLVQKIAEIDPIPVIILPGNHDFFRSAGYYDWLEWSPNVHVFKGKDIEIHKIKEKDCSIYGKAFYSQEDYSNPLKDLNITTNSAINILLHHGSLVLNDSERNPYRPFTEDELDKTPFNYIALGHYHHRREFKDRDGSTIASYCGSPEPLGFDEIYEHSINLVTIDENKTEVEFIPVNIRNYHCLEIDCSGFKSEDEIIGSCRRDAVLNGSNEDIYKFILKGTVDRELKFDWNMILDGISEDLFWARLEDNTTPAYDLQAISREETTRGYFVRTMQELIDSTSIDEQPDKVKKLNDAMFYGLDALEGRKPERR